ncbi:GntR family transcriptional regulator [Fundicoccus culcitae]|uniref:GntR family transcriptional regulator n=1 Tax=Fundicoccus culcitae TaxID=2969821 RepID=A0ABY5P4G2_9LACT|nr:GntR family transcriptional regulator [Fundicoccus culcitae]UUX33298.1 GntR family transcriptional regulator [Fundicoccus culcitae]
MPKYISIAKAILRYIQDNELEADDKLPSIQVLAEQFDVNKNTIVSALNDLERQGVIYQVRGSGVYVRGNNRKGYINLLNLNGFNSILSQFNIDSKVIGFELMEANEEIAENLKFDLSREDEEHRVYRVYRIRYIEGRPFCVEESFYAKAIIPYLSEDIASGSIFKYISQDLNIDIGYADHYFRVAQLSQEHAEYLNLKKGDPSFYLESVMHLTNGKPFDFSKIVYHYQEAQFFVQGTNTQMGY